MRKIVNYLSIAIAVIGMLTTQVLYALPTKSMADRITISAEPRKQELDRITSKISTKEINIIVKIRSASSGSLQKNSINPDIKSISASVGAVKNQKLFVTPRVSTTGGAARASVTTQSRIDRIRAAFPKRALRATTGAVAPEIDGIYSVTLPKGSDITKALDQLRGTKSVVYAYESRRYSTNQSGNPPAGRAVDLAATYGINAIKAPQVWDKTRGEGIIVAVNDTGIQLNQLDLAANIWVNTGEIPGNCIDDDKNGYVDDVNGASFDGEMSAVKKECSNTLVDIYQPYDCAGHGTHVAGTIAAVDGNNLGVVGVAPKAQLMAVKGLSDRGSGSTEGLAEAIIYATDNGADVINNSWGSGPVSLEDPALTDAIRYAYAAGVVNVFAAGNENSDMVLAHPNGMEEVITVGAIDQSNQRASFSNFGSRIDVVAPGVSVNSTFHDGCGVTVPDPYYETVPAPSSEVQPLSGTSMAAPHVTGAVALLLAYNPAMRVDDVRTVLRASADDLGAQGVDYMYGAGRVNLVKALSAPQPPLMLVRANSTLLTRDSSGKLPLYSVSGTIAGPSLASYDVALRGSESSGAWTTLARGTSAVRNGPLANINLTSYPNGNYLVRIASVTTAGTRFERVLPVTLYPESSILDQVDGYIEYSDAKPSITANTVGWRVDGFYLKSSNDAPERIEETNPTFRLRYRNFATSPRLISFDTDAKVGIPLIAKNGDIQFLERNPERTGLGVDLMKLQGWESEVSLRTNVSSSLPNVYLPTVNSVGQFWIQDTSIASYEDKIVGMLNENRGGISRDTRTTFVESAPNSFFWGSLFASNDALMTEEHSRVAGRVTKRLVSFPIAPNAYASRRVLLTSSTNFNFFELAARNKLVCYTEYQATRNGLAVVVLNTNTGRKLTLATEPNGDIGWCAIPVDNLVMWISNGKYGFVLNGYDTSTGKSGSLPLSAGASLYSFASNELGSVAWVEYFQKGTRIVELNGASFKNYINTVNPSPSPSPKPQGNNS